jgi:REP element-mobilizing transposase RayT
MQHEYPIVHAFDRSQAKVVSRRNLPHWRQEGVVYFVTFRLADSLPAEKLKCWREERETWLQANPPPHTQEQHRQDVLLWDQPINEWLDAGHGSCCLGDARAGEIVESALRYFDGSRYLLGDFVLMPNHVHALVVPMGRWELSNILHSWKSYTSHRINLATSRSGRLWQDESFDHIVRDEAAMRKFAHYIALNAERAGGRARLGRGRLSLQWSDPGEKQQKNTGGTPVLP